jgi:hypothetical protein
MPKMRNYRVASYPPEEEGVLARQLPPGHPSESFGASGHPNPSCISMRDNERGFERQGLGRIRRRASIRAGLYSKRSRTRTAAAALPTATSQSRAAARAWQYDRKAGRTRAWNPGQKDAPSGEPAGPPPTHQSAQSPPGHAPLPLLARLGVAGVLVRVPRRIPPGRYSLGQPESPAASPSSTIGHTTTITSRLAAALRKRHSGCHTRMTHRLTVASDVA